MSSVTFLSHSRKGTMQSCGKKFFYRYVEGLQEVQKSANLVFGSAVHQAAAALLTAQAFGVKVNAQEVFELEWKNTATSDVSYSALWDEDKMRATGLRLIELFQEDWAQRGWTPLLDRNGLPLVERTFKVRLPGNILFTAIIDAVVKTPDGRILVVDFKTPSSEDPEGFAELSDQLTGYQVAVDANREELGIEKVDGMLFYHLIKRPMPKTPRGKGPQLSADGVVPPRGEAQIGEWIQECQHVVGDIHRKRFFRRPMSSFDSPCRICPFLILCRGGSGDGLFTSRKMQIATIAQPQEDSVNA